MQKQAKVILASHFGRPKGVDDKLPHPVAKRLSELLGQEVVKCDDCIGEEVTSKVAAMQNGQVLLLENVLSRKRKTTQICQTASLKCRCLCE